MYCRALNTSLLKILQTFLKSHLIPVQAGPNFNYMKRSNEVLDIIKLSKGRSVLLALALGWELIGP